MDFPASWQQANIYTLVSKLFVNTGAALDYGGYGQAQEFKPASTATPIIHLTGGDKCATATL